MKTGQTIWIDGRLGVIVLVLPVSVNNVPALRVDVEHNHGHRYHPQRVEYYLPPESENEDGQEEKDQEEKQEGSHQEKEAGASQAERVPG